MRVSLPRRGNPRCRVSPATLIRAASFMVCLFHIAHAPLKLRPMETLANKPSDLHMVATVRMNPSRTRPLLGPLCLSHCVPFSSVGAPLYVHRTARRGRPPRPGYHGKLSNSSSPGSRSPLMPSTSLLAPWRRHKESSLDVSCRGSHQRCSFPPFLSPGGAVSFQVHFTRTSMQRRVFIVRFLLHPC